MPRNIPLQNKIESYIVEADRHVNAQIFFLLWDLVTVAEIHLQVVPTMRYRQVKKRNISGRYHRTPDPFTVSIVPKDKILLSSHRQVINSLHLNNNCLLKDLSIPVEHRLHLNILELPRAPGTNSALYLIRRTTVQVNLAHVSLADNLWEALW